jgi:GR25 family glycosyltransferase involved in LPS biosynthesis
VFPAFDATDSPIKIQDHDLGKPIGEMGTIKVPEMLKGQAFINFLRLRRADLLMTQIACFLSHYSLWCMCLDKDQPIVILEHDAIMVKKYLRHNYYNNIVYMGGCEQAGSLTCYD